MLLIFTNHKYKRNKKGLNVMAKEVKLNECRDGQCIIGLWRESCGPDKLVSFDDLKEEVEYCHNIYDVMKRHNEQANSQIEHVANWTLSDYLDKRISTNLYHFNHCCKCGKKIDWAQLKHSVEES